MDKNILIKLSELADELDSNNLYKEANIVTETMTRIAQEFYADPAVPSREGEQKSPINNQLAPPGYEWTYNIPGVTNGTLKPKGWSAWKLDQDAGKRIIEQMGPVAYKNNPRTQQPARSGFEWSPKGFEQPEGTGANYLKNQLSKRAPFYGQPEPAAPDAPKQAEQQQNIRGQAEQQQNFDYLGYAFSAAQRLAKNGILDAQSKNKILFEVAGLMQKNNIAPQQIEIMKSQIQSKIFNQKAFGGPGI